MTPEERRQFVRDHRTAIFGYARKNDGPAMSALYYIVEGAEILVSTMRARGKAAAVRRDPKVSLCVLDEKWPPTYLNVYCDAVVDDDPDAGADLLFKIMGVMAGRPLSEDTRAEVEAMARREERVVLRLRPYATFATPPRHVNTESDVAGLTHWTSASVPWDA
ncbi:pyridoxamine 5'-phosphate oxidase family protein [Actinoallomurus acaciae]|uniref:Pyridoxamine 5'-phosphate oxidase family protein n=1 Tax=Actinoallomurus acaciae TaxID=502577 RepID=A0ABV5YME6_9ACTN